MSSDIKSISNHSCLIKILSFLFRFVLSLNRRPDLTNGLRKLKCRTLIFVGDSSPFHSESIHMIAKLDKRYSALVEVRYKHTQE